MRRRLARALAALACMLLPAAAFAAQPLTPQEMAGKKVFEQGVSPSGGEITARVGISAFDVPGSAVPCANCHGEDGLGRPEGGVIPPNIQWSELAKSYGHVHPNGRKHPVFDETGVRRAVTQGRDPAGNELDQAMPRYTIPDEDLKSLFAYIKKLEHQLPPGVSADTLKLGTVLPLAGPFGEVGQAVRGMLETYLADLNKAGGVYGRKLELVVADYGDGPQTAYANAWKMVSEGQVFALLSPFTAGWEGELGRLASEERMPVIAPMTLFAEDTRASNLYVFHLLSGVGELGQVLAVHAAASLKLKDKPVALLAAEGKAGAELAEGLERRMREQGWTAVSREVVRAGPADAGALARRLKERKVEALFAVGTGLDLGRLAREAQAIGWTPYIMVPGPLAQRDIVELPPAFKGRVFLSYATLPRDQRPPALNDYSELFQANPKLIRSHQTLQVPAYGAATTVVEVFKRVGRDVTRAKFVQTFEALQNWDTGMLPPLSYNSDRRIGALGGYVVAVDVEKKQFHPVGGFVTLAQ